MFTSFENLDQVTQTSIKKVAKNIQVIHKHLNNVLHNIGEYRHHTSLKGSRYITQPKRNPLECKCPIRPSKGGFFLVLWCNSDLNVTRITIMKTVPSFSCESI